MPYVDDDGNIIPGHDRDGNPVTADWCLGCLEHAVIVPVDSNYPTPNVEMTFALYEDEELSNTLTAALPDPTPEQVEIYNRVEDRHKELHRMDQVEHIKRIVKQVIDGYALLIFADGIEPIGIVGGQFTEEQANDQRFIDQVLVQLSEQLGRPAWKLRVEAVKFRDAMKYLPGNDKADLSVDWVSQSRRDSARWN